MIRKLLAAAALVVLSGNVLAASLPTEEQCRAVHHKVFTDYPAEDEENLLQHAGKLSVVMGVAYSLGLPSYYEKLMEAYGQTRMSLDLEHAKAEITENQKQEWIPFVLNDQELLESQDFFADPIKGEERNLFASCSMHQLYFSDTFTYSEDILGVRK